MTTILKCHVTLWVGSPHPKSAARFGVHRPASQPARFGVNRPASQPARFGVHRPYGTNGASSISSNSNSNAEVPVPRFTNGQNKADKRKLCPTLPSWPTFLRVFIWKMFISPRWDPGM